MNDLSPTSAEKPLQRSLATAEIWLGMFLIYAIGFYYVADLLGFKVRLNGIFELLPLAALWTGTLLVCAGGLAREVPQHPVLVQFPLLLWLVFMGLSFA